MARFSRFAFLLFLLFPLLLCAQRSGRSPQRFSVSGTARSTNTSGNMDGLEVDLRAFPGGTVATAFTSANGSFEFNNVPAGSYTLVVSGPQFLPASQPLDVDGPVVGVMITLQRSHASAPVTKGPTTVSERELGIPRKAHDAMENGLRLLDKRDYQGSLQQFQRAIQLYPDYYEAYQAMGVSYDRLGNAASAEQAARKSVELSQDRYPEALVWLASLLSDSSRFTEAEQYARKGVDAAPNSWQANAELARALLGLDRAEEGEASALLAVKIQPKEPTLYLLLAEVHRALQDHAALFDDLNAYLKLVPTGETAEQVRQQRDALQAEVGKQ